MGWDITKVKLPDELWEVYLMFLRRFEDLEYEKLKSLHEFEAMLVNPEVYNEYYKRFKQDLPKEEIPIKFGTLRSGVVKGFKDEKTGTEIPLHKIEELMDKVS